ncbi:MAG TPA: GNAT family N-acetyltransferase [Casimicrobiaceae bacterium]|nr:GNAT family N-acetyltransferase [Casimicrobiaceae bacterium]
MTIAVLRLSEGLRPTVLAHFLSLPAADLYLRFGTALPPRAISGYVARLDFERAAVLGVHDADLTLAGVAHVALEGSGAEIGMSVLPGHRRRGIAQALFRRAIEHARNRGLATLGMQCLSSNAAILRMAQRLGMDIVLRGIEAQARLGLPERSIASTVGERIADAFAACDSAFKAFLAGWSHRIRGCRSGESTRPASASGD